MMMGAINKVCHLPFNMQYQMHTQLEISLILMVVECHGNPYVKCHGNPYATTFKRVEQCFWPKMDLDGYIGVFP